MRSPLVLLLTSVVAAVLVAGTVLVWAVPGRVPDARPPGEVVVGESPDADPVETLDEDVVAPPPPITDHDGDGTPDEDDPDHAEPSAAPSGPPVGVPGETPLDPCPGSDDDDDDCDDEDEDGDDDDD